MTAYDWYIVFASALLAIIPVIIWQRIIHKQGEQRSLYIRTFILGTLSVVPPFILVFVFDAYPEYNIYSIINSTIVEIAIASLVTNIIVGIIEEIAKNTIVRIVDKRHPEYFQTLSSTLKLSVSAALGFAFAENIFYYYNIWVNPAYAYTDLFSTFVFRSIITMCAHMVFSGIFGYYFGIGKFAADMTELARWKGNQQRFIRFLSRISGKLPFEVMRKLMNFWGLLLAMSMHALFNASLDLDHKMFAILIVGSGALYVWYLLHTKSGHLLFSMIKRRASSMASRDEDVVLELLGMWLKDGKLQEVVQICDRLLQRDPDNNVVKLFKAKALDSGKLRHFYASLKAVLAKTQVPATVGTVPAGRELQLNDEKIVLEFMDMWYKQGNYKQVLEIANRLMARNPDSSGARVLLEKSLDQEKLKTMFDSLGKLFEE